MNNLNAQILENAAEKIARLMTASGVRVVLSSKVKGPCADLRRGLIMLPPLPEKIDATATRYLHGALDHEAAHVQFTRRADGVHADKSAGFLGVIENALEDGRINRLQEARYPGSRDNLSDLIHITYDRIDADMAKNPRPVNTGYKIMCALLKASYIHVWKRADMAARINAAGDDILATLPADLAAKLEAITEYTDVERLAPEVDAWLKAHRDAEPPAPKENGDEGKAGKPEEGDEGESSQGEGSENDEEGTDSPRDAEEGDEGEGEEGAEGDEASDEEGDEGEAEGDADSEGDDADEGDSAEGEQTNTGVEVDEIGGEDDSTSESKGGGSDYAIADKVIETEAEVEAQAVEVSEALQAIADKILGDLVSADSQAYVADTTRDTVEHISEIYSDEMITNEHARRYAATLAHTLFSTCRTHVAQVRARLVIDLQSVGKKWTRDLRSGRSLDTGSLTRPTFADARVFKNKVKKQTLNTAATLLIDCSGSMEGERIQSALQLAALFAEALEMAGVPCEVLGFTTHAGYIPTGLRGEPLRHIVFKRFEESTILHRDKWPVVATANLLSSNADGEGVAWAAKRLVVRKEQRKILFVLSDGQPACAMNSGGLRSYTSNLLDKHLRETVKRVAQAGIEVLGIGMQTNVVRNYYPKWVAYNDLNTLMSSVYKTISDILHGREIETKKAS